VLDAESATTVITCVAPCVENDRGSRCAAAAAGRRLDDLGLGVGVGLGVRVRVVGVDGDGLALDEVVALELATLVLDGALDSRVLDGAIDRGPAAPPLVHAVASNATQARAAALRRPARPIPPGCQTTPMRMRGWADGVSHRMRLTSLDCGMATQPAVGAPSVTCRKNALPAPCRTPPGALRVL
jgi:hypothetical protein